MGDNTNATSSWSGYNHQGFVGIFVALHETLKIYNGKAGRSNEDVEEDLKKYKIVFENAEDFDIKYENTVRSRHQVKTYKGGNKKANYKKAIGKFNFTNLTEDVLCYFHVVCNVDDWDTYTGFKNEQQKLNSERIQLYEYHFCENDNSEIKQKFCPLGETIHIKSQKIISQIREKLYGKISSENNLFLLYKFLNEQISLKHQNGGYPEISFEKIIEIIKQDVNPKDVYISKLICEYILEYEKFIDELGENGQLSSKDREIVIYFCGILKQKLFSKDNSELLSMLKNWHIHKGSEENFSTHGFESIILYFCQSFFLRNIEEIEESDREDVEGFILKARGMRFTSITEERRRISSIVKDIEKNIENGRFTEDYFNGIKLITERIDGEKDFKKIGQSSDLKEKQMNFSQEDFDEDRDNINKPIKFTFISRDTALGQI